MMLHVGAPAAASHQGLSSSTNTVFLIKMCLNSSVNSALYFTWSSVRYLSYFFKFKFNSHGMEFYFSPYSLLNSAAGHLTDLHSTGNLCAFYFPESTAISLGDPWVELGLQGDLEEAGFPICTGWFSHPAHPYLTLAKRDGSLCCCNELQIWSLT